MSDFSDRPLVVGSLIGLRAFGVDRLGRLMSVYSPTPFRPGLNEAECRKGLYDSGMFFPPFVARYVGYDPLTQVAATMGAAPRPLVEKHEPGSVSCSCGFYAYFDGRNDYKSKGDISALIEGWGVCSLGDRGFRAGKAQLVALITPKALPSHVWDRVLHNYPDVPVFPRKRDALAEFPLTPPALPTPESDPEFWTRTS